MKLMYYHTPEVSELTQFRNAPRDIPQRYSHDVWPGGSAPILINHPQYSWVLGSFGLVPSWAAPAYAKHTFTARVETTTAVLSFRKAWLQRQLCVVPMSCFFVPSYARRIQAFWKVERNDSHPFGVPGLWEVSAQENGLPRWSFTVLTYNADDEPIMNNFFHREEEKRDIFVLHENEYDKWLRSPSESAMLELLHPLDATMFSASEPKLLNTV